MENMTIAPISDAADTLLEVTDMTAAFDLFMKEHNMTGSEKADGYSEAALKGLSEPEKAIAFDLLLKELPWSTKWLFLLDAQKAASVAREEEVELRDKNGLPVYLLQQQLVKHTGDLIYQQHMIEDYAKYSNRVRPLVVDALDRTPTNRAKIDFFKHVVLIEVSNSAMARAARHLLDAVDFPRANDGDKAKYERLIGDLRSDDSRAKARALDEIDNYISQIDALGFARDDNG